jgi:glycosyltransferase involved in cell wall biosynthesis
MSIRRTIVLNAPSVHTGGGFVLLQALTAAWPSNVQLTALLDARARGQVMLPDGAQVTWVDASAGSRLKAEVYLSLTAKANDVILCFHGLPPLLSNQAKVIVFLQNRLYFARKLPSGYKLKTRVRLTFERLVSRIFRYRVAEYIVQTPSMQRDVLQWYGARDSAQPAVRVLPFVEALHASPEHTVRTPDWDFVYLADGEAHKNHRTLFAAWHLLAQDGLHPSLALTLSPRDRVLKRELDVLVLESGLRIKDLGQMPHEKVLSFCATARAMIFPSTSESFGLPLIEATHAGLPILASELDYVRDVCSPVQTFDPTSAISIARAVKRFLEVPEPVLELRSPHDFLNELLSATTG